MAVQDFEGRRVTPNTYMSIKKFTDEENCKIDFVYGSLYMLLKCALSFPENSLKQEVINFSILKKNYFFFSLCLCNCINIYFTKKKSKSNLLVLCKEIEVHLIQ